ncbi:2-amino-4-hydroxy-6-hydroxymethyldihydropteridinediphosphokinase [Gammaproteobacteria bacterium]
MVTAYLSLGSNIEPRVHLSKAIQELRSQFGSLCPSPVYGSAPVGFVGDPFLNLVVSFETFRPPEEIYHFLRIVESQHGRTRNDQKHSARTLDIDLLLYGSAVRIEVPILPREEILRYAFVLRPLADLAPDERHPILNIAYSDLWNAFDSSQQPLLVVEPL